MLLRAKHESNSCHSIIIHTSDTDVLVFSIAYATDINAGLYIKTGIENTASIVDVKAVSNSLRCR